MYQIFIIALYKYVNIFENFDQFLVIYKYFEI